MASTYNREDWLGSFKPEVVKHVEKQPPPISSYFNPIKYLKLSTSKQYEIRNTTSTQTEIVYWICTGQQQLHSHFVSLQQVFDSRNFLIQKRTSFLYHLCTSALYDKSRHTQTNKMGAEITMFYQRTPKEIFPRNPPGYLSCEPSGNFSMGNPTREIPREWFQGNSWGMLKKCWTRPVS